MIGNNQRCVKMHYQVINYMSRWYVQMFKLYVKSFHKTMKFGTLVWFAAITKTPCGCHGDHFTFRHNQIMYFVSYLYIKLR